MANRQFNQYFQTLEKRPVELYAKITFASGVATISNAKGITSITRAASDGKYNIVLNDKYQALLGANVAFKDASAVPVSPVWYFTALNAAAGTATIDFIALGYSSVITYTSTAPADTTTVYLTLTLSNSTAK